MSAPFLEWIDDKRQRQRRILVDRIFIGRVCHGVDEDKRIIVAHPTISRDHAVIRQIKSGIEITDMSINGTWINKVRMAPGSSRLLNDGDTIRLAGVTITLAVPAGEDKSSDRSDWAEKTAIAPSSVQVTCLVADVRGFSGIAQVADSTATYSLMNEVFASFSRTVTAFSGTIKDYAGDAVFAFWEHPEQFSAEPALLACKAAIKQHDSVPMIDQKMRQAHSALGGLELGWGLATGPATLSHYGSRSADLALVGDCINLAFRLSSLANKKIEAPIVLCNRTAKLIGHEMALTDLGQVRTKGRSGMENIFCIGGRQRHCTTTMD